MSPYEIQARERKAAKIVDHILRCFREVGGSVEPQPIATLVLELSAAGPGVRMAFATGAGTKAPSARTWLHVIELIGRQGVLASIDTENGPGFRRSRLRLRHVRGMRPVRRPDRGGTRPMITANGHDTRYRRACSAEARIRHLGLLAWLSDRDLARYVGDQVWLHDLSVDEVLALAERRDATHRSAAWIAG